MSEVQDLVCGYCGEVTSWPVENGLQMTVYGIGHIAEHCDAAPVEVRAEAIAMMEAARRGELSV